VKKVFAASVYPESQFLIGSYFRFLYPMIESIKCYYVHIIQYHCLKIIYRI